MRKVLAATLLLTALLGSATNVLADTEAVAQVLLKDVGQTASWFEGYAETLAGEYQITQDQRVPERNALHTPEYDGKLTTISWRTSPVPKDWSGDSATFLWAAGIQVDPGSRYGLIVNGTRRLSFYSPEDWAWSVTGDDGSSLTFLAFQEASRRTRHGYMKLIVPAAWIKPGEALTLSVVPEPKNAARALVLVFQYPEALAYFRSNEFKNIHCEASDRLLGTVTLKLVASAQLAGKEVVVKGKNGEVAKVTLSADGEFAKATLMLPRHQQQNLRGSLDFCVDGQTVATLEAPVLDEQRVKSFLDEQLCFKKYVFHVGDFPSVSWARPGMVENEMGSFDLQTEFYDAEMNLVTRAEKPGRYGAVVSAAMPGGYQMKRYVTLYCVPQEWRTWEGDKFTLSSAPFAKSGIAANVWQAHQKTADDFLSTFITEKGSEDSRAAIFLAGMHEIDANAALPEWQSDPFYRDRQWWVSFKCKQAAALGWNFAPLAPLKQRETPARVLRQEDPATVGYKPEQVAAIRNFCQEWSEKSEQPFTVLIARKGVIVLHEAFGKQSDGSPMPLDKPTWMASITKVFTGILMMQCVDQGLVNLDEPISKYLPELSGFDGPQPTIRHLFTHTSGLPQGKWTRDDNASVENVLGQCISYAHVGEKYEYAGVGYAVGGKIIERITGRAFPYLVQERLFEPLDARHSIVSDTAGGARSISMDMAKIAQMLLNRGSYGKMQFMSEESFEKMYPRKLGDLVTDTEAKTWCWGIGITFMDYLTERIIGHGAASNALLHIYPDYDMFIVQCRDSGGKNDREFREKFFELCEAPCKQEQKQD